MNFQKQFSKIDPKYLELLPDFKERKTQAFTTLSLTLVALSLLGVFAISPTLSTITELRRQHSDSEFVYEKLTEKLTNLGLLQQKYAALEGDMPAILAALPEKPSVPILIGEIQALAKKNSTTISHIEVFEVDLGKVEEGPRKYSAFTFAVDAQGDYKNLLDFSKALVEFQRIVTLENIAINKSVSESNIKPKLNIRGQAYFKK